MKKIIVLLLGAMFLPSLALAAGDNLAWSADYPYTATCDSTEIQAFGSVTFGNPPESLHLTINGQEYPTVVSGSSWTVNNTAQGLSNTNSVDLPAGSNFIDLKLVGGSGNINDEYTKTYVVPACVASSSVATTTSTTQTTQQTTPVTTQNVQPSTPPTDNTATLPTTQTVQSQDDSQVIALLQQMIQLLTVELQLLKAKATQA